MQPKSLGILLGAALAAIQPALAHAAPAARVAGPRPLSQAVLANPVLAELAGITHGKAKSPGRAQAGTLNYPYGLAVDAAGTLYVANIFAGVNLYSGTTHKLVSTITAGLNYPAAVAISFGGNIYVANNAGDNITIYNPALTQIGTISDPTLYSPGSLYIDQAGDIWALDAAGTLHTYLDNGTPAGSLASGGTAVGPWGPNVTVWGEPNGPGSYSESYQNVGEALHNGPSLPNAYIGGSPEAGGEAQDASGQQYVTDFNNNQVQIWASNGAYEVASIATPATPFGIAVDSTRGRIYVALTTSNQIVVYSIKAPYKYLFTIK